MDPVKSAPIREKFRTIHYIFYIEYVRLEFLLNYPITLLNMDFVDKQESKKKQSIQVMDLDELEKRLSKGYRFYKQIRTTLNLKEEWDFVKLKILFMRQYSQLFVDGFEPDKGYYYLEKASELVDKRRKINRNPYDDDVNFYRYLVEIDRTNFFILTNQYKMLLQQCEVYIDCASKLEEFKRKPFNILVPFRIYVGCGMIYEFFNYENEMVVNTFLRGVQIIEKNSDDVGRYFLQNDLLIYVQAYVKIIKCKINLKDYENAEQWAKSTLKFIQDNSYLLRLEPDSKVVKKIQFFHQQAIQALHVKETIKQEQMNQQQMTQESKEDNSINKQFKRSTKIEGEGNIRRVSQMHKVSETITSPDSALLPQQSSINTFSDRVNDLIHKEIHLNNQADNTNVIQIINENNMKNEDDEQNTPILQSNTAEDQLNSSNNQDNNQLPQQSQQVPDEASELFNKNNNALNTSLISKPNHLQQFLEKLAKQLEGPDASKEQGFKPISQIKQEMSIISDQVDVGSIKQQQQQFDKDKFFNLPKQFQASQFLEKEKQQQSQAQNQDNNIIHSNQHLLENNNMSTHDVIRRKQTSQSPTNKKTVSSDQNEDNEENYIYQEQEKNDDNPEDSNIKHKNKHSINQSCKKEEESPIKKEQAPYQQQQDENIENIKLGLMQSNFMTKSIQKTKQIDQILENKEEEDSPCVKINRNKYKKTSVKLLSPQEESVKAMLTNDLLIPINKIDTSFIENPSPDKETIEMNYHYQKLSLASENLHRVTKIVTSDQEIPISPNQLQSQKVSFDQIPEAQDDESPLKSGNNMLSSQIVKQPLPSLENENFIIRVRDISMPEPALLINRNVNQPSQLQYKNNLNFENSDPQQTQQDSYQNQYFHPNSNLDPNYLQESYPNRQSSFENGEGPHSFTSQSQLNMPYQGGKYLGKFPSTHNQRGSLDSHISTQSIPFWQLESSNNLSPLPTGPHLGGAVAKKSQFSDAKFELGGVGLKDNINFKSESQDKNNLSIRSSKSIDSIQIGESSIKQKRINKDSLPSMKKSIKNYSANVSPEKNTKSNSKNGENITFTKYLAHTEFRVRQMSNWKGLKLNTFLKDCPFISSKEQVQKQDDLNNSDELNEQLKKNNLEFNGQNTTKTQIKQIEAKSLHQRLIEQLKEQHKKQLLLEDYKKLPFEQHQQQVEWQQNKLEEEQPGLFLSEADTNEMKNQKLFNTLLRQNKLFNPIQQPNQYPSAFSITERLFLSDQKIANGNKSHRTLRSSTKHSPSQQKNVNKPFIQGNYQQDYLNEIIKQTDSFSNNKMNSFPSKSNSSLKSSLVSHGLTSEEKVCFQKVLHNKPEIDNSNILNSNIQILRSSQQYSPSLRNKSNYNLLQKNNYNQKVYLTTQQGEIFAHYNTTLNSQPNHNIQNKKITNTNSNFSSFPQFNTSTQESLNQAIQQQQTQQLQISQGQQSQQKKEVISFKNHRRGQSQNSLF